MAAAAETNFISNLLKVAHLEKSEKKTEKGTVKERILLHPQVHLNGKLSFWGSVKAMRQKTAEDKGNDDEAEDGDGAGDDDRCLVQNEICPAVSWGAES